MRAEIASFLVWGLIELGFVWVVAIDSAGGKSLGFRVSIEINLFHVWVVAFDVISVWWIELDFISVWG